MVLFGEQKVRSLHSFFQRLGVAELMIDGGCSSLGLLVSPEVFEAKVLERDGYELRFWVRDLNGKRKSLVLENGGATLTLKEAFLKTRTREYMFICDLNGTVTNMTVDEVCKAMKVLEQSPRDRRRNIIRIPQSSA